MHDRRRKVSSGELGEFVIRQIFLIGRHIAFRDVIFTSTEIIAVGSHLTKTLNRILWSNLKLAKNVYFIWER